MRVLARTRLGTGYTVTAGNRVTGDGTWTYAYDNAGQVVGKSKSGEYWTYAYDHRGQMLSASKATSSAGTATDEVAYTYDAFGNRLSREQSGGTSTLEKYVLDGWDTGRPTPIGTENFDVVMELDASDSVAMRRMFGADVDDLVARQDALAGVQWYGTDRQGTVRQIFDNSGTETTAIEYDAFGIVLNGVMLDRYGFTGREHDPLTLDRHHRIRPTNGQFWLTPDPIGFAAGDTNLMRYADNNPTSFIDPSGYAGFDSNKIDASRIDSMIKDGLAIEHKGYVIVTDSKTDGKGIYNVILESYTAFELVDPRKADGSFDLSCLSNPVLRAKQYYRMVNYAEHDVSDERRDELLKERTRYGQGTIEYYRAASQLRSDANFNELFYGAVLNTVPGINAINKLQAGNAIDVIVAVAEDGSVFLGIGGLIKAGKAGRIMLRASSVGQGGAAGIQGTRGVIALVDGENEKAILYFGDATLRLLGLGATEIAILRNGRKEVIDAIAKARKAAGGPAGDCEAFVREMGKILGKNGKKTLKVNNGAHEVYVHEGIVIDGVGAQYARNPRMLKQITDNGLKTALESGKFTVDEHIQFMKITKNVTLSPKDYIIK